MKRFLYILPILMFFSACQKDIAPKQKGDFSESEEVVINHVNIPLTDEQLNSLLSVVTPIAPDTRSHFFNVTCQADIDFFSGGLCVVLFDTPSCPHCIPYRYLFENYALECTYVGTRFGHCSINNVFTQEVARNYEIRQVPTTVFIRNYNVVAYTIAALTRDTLHALVEQYKVE